MYNSNSGYKSIIGIAVVVLAVLILTFVTCGNFANRNVVELKERVMKVYDVNGSMIFEQRIGSGVQIKSIVIEDVKN
jgi:hypothetical protein